MPLSSKSLSSTSFTPELSSRHKSATSQALFLQPTAVYVPHSSPLLQIEKSVPKDRARLISALLFCTPCNRLPYL